MVAYMINDYYICTSFEEVSLLVHDILHHTKMPAGSDKHFFHISKGRLDIVKQVFILDSGRMIELCYEEVESIFYKAM